MPEIKTERKFKYSLNHFVNLPFNAFFLLIIVINKTIATINEMINDIIVAPTSTLPIFLIPKKKPSESTVLEERVYSST